VVCLDVNKYFAITSSVTRGHPYKLYKAQCGNPKRRSFFSERIVNVSNSLPAKVDFSSLPRFKKSHKLTSRSSWSVMCDDYVIYNLYYFFCYVFLFLVCLFLALCIWNVCLVSDICIRQWAVIGARREPYCPARCELIFVTAVLCCWAK